MAKHFRTAAKFRPLTMLFYVLIIGLIGYILIKSQAAPPAPTIYINPSLQSLPANTTFTVDIREDSGTTAVNAVQANISYPATLLDFVSIDATTSAFPVEAQSTGGSGAVTVARGITTSVSGDKLIAKVTFRTKTTGGNAALAFTTGTSMYSAATNADLLGSLSATGGANINVDTTAPSVSVSTPANGSTLAGGSNVTVTALATDTSGVQSVDILIDGIVRATLTAAPYTYTWNTSSVALGAHTIAARATDAVGLTATSTTTNVTLADQTAPTTSITAPTAGATIIGSTTITASAADNTGGTGVSKVEFYVDNVLKSTDTTTPYSYAWDSKTATDGAHSLTVKAYDNGSPQNVGTSAAINVTVDNADRTAPTTPGNLTMSARTLTSITLTWTASTDNIGVTGYRVQRNGATIATVTAPTLTYTSTGLTPGTTYSFSVAAVDAANNFSTAASINATTIAQVIGDVDGNGNVNLTDLSIMLSNWNSTTNATCDLSGNGKVDIVDLSMLLSRYGT